MTTSDLSNQPRAFALGLQAGKDFRTAGKASESGDARAVVALTYSHWDGDEYIAVLPGKDGDVGESHTFSIADLRRDPIGADGKVDGKLKKARLDTVVATLFGINEPEPRTMQSIRRAMAVSAFLCDTIARIEDEEQMMDAMDSVELIKRRVRRNGDQVEIAFLAVPQFCLFDPADKALKLTEKQIEQNNKRAFDQVELDNTDFTGVAGVRSSLRTLARRADAAAGRGAGSNNRTEATPETQFTTSITFINNVLRYWSDPEGGADKRHEKFAASLSTARKLDLFILQTQIAAVLAADPLTDEEKAQLDKRMAA